MPSAPTAFSRRLTTSAQVHPKILPYMHNRGPLFQGPGLRRVPLYAAIGCVGYALAASYQSSRAGGRSAQDSHLTPDREALLDAYGGRDSLEQLEMASRVYSSQAQGAQLARNSQLSEEKEALLEAYGGRESLEQLELAARVYNSQHPGR